MSTVKTYNQNAKEVGSVKLNDKIFNVEIKQALLHQVMVAQMSNERQVLAHTKDRSEVRGGGKKPWKQKGTGRARVGSRRSPIWIGGGITFGPRKDRNFKKNINKKMKQKATFMVFSDRLNTKNLVILEEFKWKDYNTKEFNKILQNLEENLLPQKTDKKGEKIKNKKRSLLIINDKIDEKVRNSGRNLEGVKIINLNNINILDLLKYRNLIITENITKELEKRLV